MAKKEKNVACPEETEQVICKGQMAEGDISEKLMDEDLLEQATAFFKIFADRTRLRILLAFEGKELCVHSLTHILNMNQTTLSHQLKILRDGGLVSFRRVDKHVFYRLRDEHVKQILDIAAEHIAE